MLTIPELFALALSNHQSGNLQQAQELYGQVLAADPKHAEAWHFLGLLAHQAGQQEPALEFMRRSLALDASRAACHCNLGSVCMAAGRLSEAVACYEEALRRQPDLAEAHNNLANALKEQRRHGAAADHYQQALRLRPEYAEAHNGLGTILKEKGRLEAALVCYQQALRIRPDYASAQTNLGAVLMEQGQLKEAIDCHLRAVQLQPGLAEAHHNLGNALKRQGKFAEAVDRYRHALRLCPNLAEAHYDLGIALSYQGKMAESLASFTEALRLKPSYAEAHNNLGIVLANEGRLDEAASSYRQAVQHKPDFPGAHNNLGVTLLEQGKMAEAVACFREALRLQPDSVAAHTNLLVSLIHDPQADPDLIFAEHCLWGKAQARAPSASHANDPNPERTLRVGYVFADNGANRFFEPILASHDPGQIEAICYTEMWTDDVISARLRALARGWRLTNGLSDEQLVDLVRADGVDILVDLAGHTAKHRLRAFAYKPAPVQVTYLGYPNTTGLTTMDYKLTDAVLDPPGEPERYTEQLVRLPGGVACFSPPEPSPPVTPLPARRSGQFTFGSLHRLAKLNARVFDLWCQVLQAVPSARLLIFRHTLTGELKERVRRQFTDRGIAADRLDLRHEIPASGYLAVYGDIDISLDVFPWTGGTTTCEALWMGVPVLALHGDRHSARGSASILSCIGLTEFVAQTPEAYVDLAARWAGDLERLAVLRSELRRLMGATLCDGKRFTRELESAYRVMWRKWCARHPEPGR